ncbi:M56 family metallopeptidase [uncultured Parabacteroides sp.]|uniref:M56 family metallopeptidase n=1 Tax=uncultured Parabacteroides sp. TaxID=512312 RepID=UPI0025E1A312|nr:M56 family metallopeptidase [uncultured Parabacteroides sp.]
MGIFLVFIMKSTCCLAVFYLFYRLLLSRDTFHRFNRMALLSVIAFSIAIPFIRLVADEPAVVQRTVLDIERLLQMAGTPAQEEAGELSFWLAALFMVYAGGCLFFAGRFLYSVWHIVRLIRSGEVAVLGNGARLVVTDRTVPPFSWMKYIVISRIDMEESGAEILAHEQAHIRACHSLDMWLAGCCVILHWFNPAAWLLKQELQNVHEYEADESVIAHGVDAKHYQLLLIKKAVGAQRFTSMANSFNHSKLKKRITMMLKQKSNPWARLKYLYVLPLAAVTVAAFARPEISSRLERISDVELAEVLTSRQDKKKMSQAQKEEAAKKLKQDSEQLKQDSEQLKQKAKAMKEVARKEKTQIEMTVNQEPREDVVVIGYRSMEQQDGKVFDIIKKDTLLLRPLEFKSNMRPAGGALYAKPDPLVIVDGVEYTGTLDKIDANKIESMSILKDERAQEMYGSKAAGGVILITTKRMSIK